MSHNNDNISRAIRLEHFLRHSIKAGGFPFYALLFILKHPSLWFYCFFPFVINLCVVIIVWHYSRIYFEQLFQFLLSKISVVSWGISIITFIFSILTYVLSFVASLIVSFITANVASIPFNDILSEKTEILNGTWTAKGDMSIGKFIKTSLLLIYQELYRMMLFAFISICLFVLSFVPIIGLVSVVLFWISGCYYISFDYFAYPLERRGVLLFKDKLSVLKSDFGTIFGFGSVMTLLVMIPVLRYTFIPIGVVSTALLMKDVDFNV